MSIKSYLTAAKELSQNPGQWKAYESEGNVVILAGPGSGKTKTITVKMAKILHEEVPSPRGIACVTYNSESARELKRRLSALGIYESPRVFVGTIHSFCFQQLLIPFGRLAGLEIPEPLSVADQTISQRIFEECFAATNPHEQPRDVRPRMDRYRRTHLNRMDPRWKGDDEETASLIEAYETALRQEGLVDFDDMIIMGHSLLAEHAWVRQAIEAKFPVFVVDEYQDLGTALHEIVLTLGFESNVRIIAVGDPDQSIYDFTGANPNLLHELADREGVDTIRLSLNYRNGKSIVATSLVVLDENREYESAREYDGVISIMNVPEGVEKQAEIICSDIIPSTLRNEDTRRLGDIAILYPNRLDAAVIRRAVKDHNLKYIGGDKQLRYIASPLTQWLEDCAAWCSGGWREAQPRLSALLYFWMTYVSQRRRFETSSKLRFLLTKFLMTHRDPEIPLRKWLDDLLEMDFRTIISEARGRPGELESFDSLYEATGDKNKMGDFTVGGFGGLRGASDHLHLATLHSSKGLEFDTVIMMGLEDGKIPSFQSASNPFLRREQRRLFYVGLTRARYEVFLLSSGFYVNGYGRIFRNGPSPYIEEVRMNLGHLPERRGDEEKANLETGSNPQVS